MENLLKSSEKNSLQLSHFPKAFTYSLAGVLCFYSVTTFTRNFDWKDHLTLFKHDIKHVSNSSMAHNLLAVQLMKHSYEINDPVEQNDLRNEALGHFKSAIEIYPSFYNVAFDLGRTYVALNIPDSALVYFKRAIAIDSVNCDAHLYVAKLFVENKRSQEAIPYFEYRIKMAPTDYASYETLSYIYFSLNEYEKSIVVNTKAVKQFPVLPDPLINIGRTFMSMNKLDSARLYFQKALTMNPNNPGVTQLLQEIDKK